MIDSKKHKRRSQGLYVLAILLGTFLGYSISYILVATLAG